MNDHGPLDSPGRKPTDHILESIRQLDEMLLLKHKLTFEMTTKVYRLGNELNAVAERLGEDAPQFRCAPLSYSKVRATPADEEKLYYIDGDLAALRHELERFRIAVARRSGDLAP